MDGLGLSESVVSVFRDVLGHAQLTPVQKVTIPRFLRNADVVVSSATGSGKSLAFVMPVVELLLRRDAATQAAAGSGPLPARCAARWGALIVLPTRELAAQLRNVLAPFATATGLETLQLTGGTSVAEDEHVVRNQPVDVVVGTPGRVEDVIARTSDVLRWSAFEVLVLDEADVLLSMGFERSLTTILAHLPKQRRTGLFSATQTKEVEALVRAGLRNPVMISVQVQAHKTPKTLGNFYTVMQATDKLHALCDFIRRKRKERAKLKLVVFFATCASVAFFEKVLPQLLDQGPDSACPVKSLHGRMPQAKRSRTYDAFVALPSGVLLCTDVAARGVDIPDVDWIVQFDPPQDPNFFVHRVGRTARAGRKGMALVFLLPKETAFVNLMQSRDVPLDELAEAERPDTDAAATAATLRRVRDDMVLKDRDVLERGTKAFVAFIRSYKEHQCPFIFRFASLDLLAVAKSFVLLRLPTMAELRQSKGIPGFEEAPASVVNAIPFKDRQREKQRQENYRSRTERRLLLADGEDAGGKAGNKDDKKLLSKKKKKKAGADDNGNGDGDGDGEDKKKRRKTKKEKREAVMDEFDALGSEQRLHKRFRQGRISKKEYEERLWESMDL